MNEQQQEALEELVRVLRDRFGRRTTLGEALAAIVFLNRLTRGESLGVSELAHLSGESVSNVSRWLKRVRHVELINDPSDERRKLIRITDWDVARSHYSELASIFGRME